MKGLEMSDLSKEQLVDWLLKEAEAADEERRTYLSEIVRYIQTTQDRRNHFSWGAGDVEIVRGSGGRS